MTSPRATSRRRSTPLYVLVVVLLGWTLATGHGRDADPVEPAGASATTTTTTAPLAAFPSAPRVGVPTDLPLPEDAPADPNAPTPEVVHGTLALPTLGVSQPLHESVTLTAINRGPSHWPGTAMPGEVGNVVVAGHRTTHTKPFYDLDKLVPGDPLVFTMNDGTVWTYELTGVEIVGPDAMHIVDQKRELAATLFACHPLGSAAQRIVARFALVGATPP
jgi:sortase A